MPTPLPTAPTPPPPVPLPPGEDCPPGTTNPACQVGGPPIVEPPPTTTTPPPPPPPEPAEDSDGGGGMVGDWLYHWMTDWIWDLFSNMARSALNGMLDLLGTTLLETPALDEFPVMGQVWGASRDIMIGVYALVIVIAGLVVMAYQTMQTRTTVREALPRLVVAFVAANMSMFLGGLAISFVNALSQAVLGNRVGLDEATRAFTDTLRGGFPDDNSYGELYVLFTILALVVMLVCVALTYVVRITLTIILLAAAPLVLMCHALPQTEAIAFWWWKSFGAVLAIQLAQAFTFAAAIRMFYLPGGISLF